MDAEKLACECVYYALFRLVEISELEDPEAAITWAEEALSVAGLRQGLVDAVRERMDERDLAESAKQLVHS